LIRCKITKASFQSRLKFVVGLLLVVDKGSLGFEIPVPIAINRDQISNETQTNVNNKIKSRVNVVCVDERVVVEFFVNFN